MKVTYLFFTITVLVLLSASSCDKNDDAPFYSDADRARCAHIDRDADLGDYLYSICLASPYPTTVTPGPPTQDGGLPVEGLPNGRQGVFTGWINDTIAFQSWGVDLLPTEYAVAKLAYERGGTPSVYRIIRGGWGTYAEVSPKGASIRIRLLPDGRIFNNNLSGTYLNLSEFGSLTGRYALDSTAQSINITRWDDQVVSGTIDAWFYDPDDPSRRVHFSEGWFDLTVRPQ